MKGQSRDYGARGADRGRNYHIAEVGDDGAVAASGQRVVEWILVASDHLGKGMGAEETRPPQGISLVVHGNTLKCAAGIIEVDLPAGGVGPRVVVTVAQGQKGRIELKADISESLERRGLGPGSPPRHQEEDKRRNAPAAHRSIRYRK